MATSIRLGPAGWAAVREHLAGSDQERMAYLLARATRWETGGVDLLVTRVIPVPDQGLSQQSPAHVVPDPAVTRELLIACYETGLSLIDVHSHPFATDTVTFSGRDMANMAATHRDFLNRMPADPPVGVASLVVGRRSVAGAATDPATLQLGPLASLLVIGDQRTEVELCQP
ncbi:hypothetical protein ACOBQX_07705 [Actinokineospora sp. G85]|uniref:hypothetical protein n=1 Tax=Actinokineospora sp. G85 TaxID=3406626 RepID=UPI003C734733